MNKHIIMGRGRIVHKKNILHYGLHNHSHLIGRGSPAVKKNYESIGEGMKHLKISHKGHIKPLKFKC